MYIQCIRLFFFFVITWYADICILYQCEPPRDVEAYIHRSGRTGRAGISTGFAIGLLWDCDIGVIDLRLYCGFVFIQVILGLL